MYSRPKAAADGVSKMMLIVIVAMLAIILFPAILVSVPFSKVVITITNVDTAHSVTGYLSIHAADYGTSIITLMPGDERVLSYPLKAGTYDISMYYTFQNTFQNDSQYNGGTFMTTVSVLMFETEEVHIELARQ